MTMIASGTRISAVTILRIMTSGARAIEPLAHFLAGLEERHRLLLDRDVGAGARVAAGPRRAVLDGEGAEAAQLDPIAARHGRDDLTENGVDDIFHVALVEMRVLRRDALHELGLDHRCCRPWPDGTNRSASSSRLEGAKGPDRKSTRLNSSHLVISYAVFCLKKKKKQNNHYSPHTTTYSNSTQKK